MLTQEPDVSFLSSVASFGDHAASIRSARRRAAACPSSWREGPSRLVGRGFRPKSDGGDLFSGTGV